MTISQLWGILQRLSSRSGLTEYFNILKTGNKQNANEVHRSKHLCAGKDNEIQFGNLGINPSWGSLMQETCSDCFPVRWGWRGVQMLCESCNPMYKEVSPIKLLNSEAKPIYKKKKGSLLVK